MYPVLIDLMKLKLKLGGIWLIKNRVKQIDCMFYHSNWLSIIGSGWLNQVSNIQPDVAK